MYIGRPAFIERLNDMSFWYPIVERLSTSSKMPDINIFKTGDGKLTSSETKKDFVLNIPKTQLFYVSNEIGRIIDGDDVPEFNWLVEQVQRELKGFGGELFLRTGQTSNKHEWSDTCYVTDPKRVGLHLGSLIEFSMMVDLPYTTFAVREMIKTKPVGTAFRGMPIAQEVRMFVSDGKVLCAHPYWAKEAFEGQTSITPEQIDELNTLPDMTELYKLAEYVGSGFGYAWSIDFMQDEKDNWWLTDMALASTSYHYPDCPNGKRD